MDEKLHATVVHILPLGLVVLSVIALIFLWWLNPSETAAPFGIVARKFGFDPAWIAAK